MRTSDFLLLVSGAMLWGTSGLAGATLASQGLGMLTVATLRLAVGGGVLLVGLALARRLHRLPRTRAAVSRVVITGVLAAAYQSCYFLAVQMTSVSVATLVALGAAPVLVAGATAVRTRRRPSSRTVVAIALAVVGLVLLVGVSSGGERPVLGVALALVAAGAFATMTVANRVPVVGLDPLALTGTAFTLGAVILLPVTLVAATGGVPTAISGWLLVAYLGVGPTAAAYVAYFAGLRTVPSTTASLLALLEPLTAALGAFVLRGEDLGAGGVVGAALLG
ncbi:MAG: EamA family transporter, partial [Cellulomonadaceae bacterium]|nr:EamA family transporter [Cellulomonadaceae bacterium]